MRALTQAFQVALIAGLAHTSASACTGCESVPLYGLYEKVIDYEQVTGQVHTYADPFYGVALVATFKSPSGDERPTWRGFYDGDGSGGQSGNIWKIRFMPDEPGIWSFTWQFGDGSANSDGPIEFLAADDEQNPRKPGPLRHDPDIPQWFVTADGARHIFPNMYNRWEPLLSGPYVNPQSAVADVKDGGFPVIALFSTHWYAGNDTDDPANPKIFMDTASYTPRLAGWHLLEGVYREAYDNDVYVYDWDGFYSGNDLYDLYLRPEALQDDVIRYWVARTAPYFMLMYNVGFELPEYVQVPEWPVARAQFVKSVDPWNHVITGHENADWSYGPHPVMDFSALQRNESFHAAALEVWNSPSQAHPHCSECIWNAPWQTPGTESSHREDLWDMLTGGMSVFFCALDDATGLASFATANAFLENGVRWWTMEPRDDVVVSGDARVLANIGTEYVVYSNSGASLTLDLPANAYQWRWLDPQTGVYGGLGNMTWPGGAATFAKPVDAERVLWLSVSGNTLCTDLDQDGSGVESTVGCSIVEADCNDSDPGIFPSATEICDGIDNDCDAGTADGSGQAPPHNSNPNGVCAGTYRSCSGTSGWQDDYSGIVGHEPVEISCDGLDNDCDGEIDESCSGLTCFDFDLSQGTHQNTIFLSGRVELASGTSGTYTGTIHDAGEMVDWNYLSWTPGAPYGVGLPGGQAVEPCPGGIDMSGNVLLMHLDETAGEIHDASGNGNDGASDGPAYGMEGRFGSALGFDAYDDVVEVPAHPTLQSAQVTVAAWVYPVSLPAYSAVLMKTSSVDWADGFGLSHHAGAGDINFWINDENTGAATGTIGLNEWAHVTGTYDGTDVRLYVNGTLSQAVAEPSGILHVPASLQIGKGRGPSAAFVWDGRIDEVAIWNRALSEEEVADLYGRGALHLTPSVRSCDDAACAGEEESWSALEGEPPQALSVLSDDRYLQYRFEFLSEDDAQTPILHEVLACYSPPVCSDGTPLESCADTPPDYCDGAGLLVARCEICGCPEPQVCLVGSGTCRSPGGGPVGNDPIDDAGGSFLDLQQGHEKG